MKIFAIVFIAAMLLCGCDPTQKITTLNNGGKIGYNTTEIEGCEYFVFVGQKDNSVTHKGNCKNPIHFHNQ